MQNRRSQLQQHPDFHITSSTILASTLHITRLNTRNPGVNAEPGLTPRPGSDQVMPASGIGDIGRIQERLGNEQEGQTNNPPQTPGQPELRQAETGPNPGTMSSFSSLLLWILGGAHSEGLNSFLSIFRDMRDQGQAYSEQPRQDQEVTQGSQ